MPDQIKIITTEDGSKSLYHEGLNETYHSTHGALTESQHVFIKHGLDYLRNQGKELLNVLEVGFGTGLNALLTQAFAIQYERILLDYTTLEPFPISDKLISGLDYYEPLKQYVSKGDFLRLHTCEWGIKHEFTHNFTFTKLNLALQQFDTTSKYDVIFYDAFAPNKQSEMWERELLFKVASLLNHGGVLVTYCAKGQFKRDLNDAGLIVQTLPGPPGKKEMVRALGASTDSI